MIAGVRKRSKREKIKKKRSKCGKGCMVSFNKGIVSKIKKSLANKQYELRDGVKIALAAARRAVKQVGGHRNINIPRVIQIPKSGGFLPFLLPIFAGLGAIGSIASGTSAIVNAVNNAKNAQAQLAENDRHNRTMESIALGKTKTGSGLYLKPYKKGFGLVLKHTKN